MQTVFTKARAGYHDRQQNFLGDYTPVRKQDLDFSNAENPLGCSPLALEAIRRHLGGVHHYPSPVSADLSAVLRQVHALPEKGLNVLVTAGAGAGILLCVQALLRPGQHVVMPEATFPLALFGATVAHGAGRMVRMGLDLRIDLKSLAAATDRDTAFVFLSNPNNPTGEILPVQTIIDFAASLKVPVVVSEANADYAEISCLDHQTLPDNLIIIRSFSKIHGLAGLRVGAVIAGEKIIRTLEAARCPFTVTSLSEVAAIAALQDKGHLARSRDFMGQQRAFLERELVKLGLRTLPSFANTMMVQIPDRCKSATEFTEGLAERGCTVIDGSNFCPAASRFIRISPRTAEQNFGLILTLEQVVS